MPLAARAVFAAAGRREGRGRFMIRSRTNRPGRLHALGQESGGVGSAARSRGRMATGQLAKNDIEKNYHWK
jgi:hypothetical protein